MPKGKPLCIATRSAIITLHNEKYSVRKISEKLKISNSTAFEVHGLWKITIDQDVQESLPMLMMNV